MELDLEAIEKRVRKASPGPWSWWTSNSFRRLSSDATGRDGDVLRGTVAKYDGHPDIVCSEEDRDFISNARKDVPDLLAEVRQLRARLEKADRLIASATSHRPDSACQPDEVEFRDAITRVLESLGWRHVDARATEIHRVVSEIADDLDSRANRWSEGTDVKHALMDAARNVRSKNQ